MTTISGIIKDAGGNLQQDIEVRFVLHDKAVAQSGGDVNIRETSTVSSATGVFTLSVAPGKYDIFVDGVMYLERIDIPDGQTYTLKELEAL